MLLSCQRTWLALWTLASFYPYLAHALTLSVATTQPIPGGQIQIESTTTSADPSTANLYIYDTSTNQATSLWTGWPAPQSPHSIFTIPGSVSPGTNYVVQAISTSGALLATSAVFQIFAANAVPSGSGISATGTGQASSGSFSPTTFRSSTDSGLTTASRSTTASNPFMTSIFSTASSSSTSSTPPPTATSAPQKSIPMGAILGGVLGGLALIAIVLALLLFLRRRQPPRPTPFSVDKAPPPELFPSQVGVKKNPSVSPFTLTSPPILSQRAEVRYHPILPDTPKSSGSGPGPSTPLLYPRSEKTGVFSPGSAGGSTGFSSPEDLSSKKRMMVATHGHSQSPSADVRRELDELRVQVQQLQSQNQAVGLSVEAPPLYDR